MMQINGEQISYLMAINQLTFQALSEKSGLSKTTLCQVMKGDKQVTRKTAGKLAFALGVELDAILAKG